MKKFAQILNNKAHWIFESEERPKFATNIVLIEITGNIEVKEGWNYNEGTKTFCEFELNPGIVEEKADEEKVAMAEAIIAFEQRITELENKLNGGM